jgi:CBS domain-containing protein
VLVAQEGRLLGIFTQRDVLDKVADRFDQLKDRPVREVMTPDPLVVYETDNPATALSIMAEHGLRHVPVLDVDEKIVGVVSPKRVTAFLQKHFEPPKS